MKQKEAVPTIDYEQPLSLTIEHPPFLTNSKEFTINGLYLDEAQTIQEAVEADFAARAVQRTAESRKASRRAAEAAQPIYVEPSRRDKVRQYFADGHIRRFDRQHGSNLYGELCEKRRKDALFLKASQIGLLGRDSDYYKAKLKKLAK